MKRNFEKWALWKLAILFACMTSSMAYAAGYQKFYDFAYDNPASLNLIKKGDIIIGNFRPWGIAHFTGKVGTPYGTATSSRNTNFPYGRVAWRLNPRWVVGLDVTNLVYLNTSYPLTSIVSPANLQTVLKDVNVSPRFSFQATPKLALGLGINADRLYRAELSSVISNRIFKQAGQSWAYGWMAGLSYTPRLGSILNLSYASQVNQKVRGNSHFGPLSTHNFHTRIPIPSVYTINLIQALNKQLFLSGTFRWQRVYWRALVLQNTALGNRSILLYYHPAWMLQLGAKYQYTPKWAFLGGAQYDSNPQSVAYRSPGLPSSNFITGIIGGEYGFAKGLSARVVYSYSVGKPAINTVNTVAGKIVGRYSIHISTLDTSLIWHIA